MNFNVDIVVRHYPPLLVAAFLFNPLTSLLPFTIARDTALAQVQSQPAVELSCDQQPTLKSRESKEPATLRFKNDSAGTVVLQWIGYDGALKEYGTLEPGAEKTMDTFLTHPWIVAYGEGSCRQIFLAAPGVSVARIKPEAELPKRTAPKSPPPKQSTSECPPGSHMMDGRCQVPRQQSNQCGRNEVYSSSMGQCIPR